MRIRGEGKAGGSRKRKNAEGTGRKADGKEGCMERNEWREREGIYACWLCSCPDMGNRQMHLLSELCGGPEAAYFAGPKSWGRALTPEQVERLKIHTAGWKPKEEYHRMREAGTELVTVGDALYPRRLKEIPDAPYGLFFRGRLPEEGVPAVAVIGARECSEYGKYVARRLGEALGRNGMQLISGMARGIDGISQEAALEAGGYSAGVLGCGVDICYPARNKSLYERLRDRGAVLSSYPSGTPAYARNFPPRNRIVSGLADAVVVIEARARSGTLITVDMALEQGREVYVVPGRVTDRLSDGCNRLIRQGAGMLLSPEEFVEEIRMLWEREKDFQTRKPQAGSCRRASPEKTSEGGGFPRGKFPEKKIPEEKLPQELEPLCRVLDFTPKSIDEIRGALPRSYQDKPLSAWLMRLTMEGAAVQVSPGHFCLKG